METVIVTAAIIWAGDLLLITQRKKGSHQELKWEFPGGKMEAGEDPESCLRREIREELNLNIQVIDIYKVVFHKYENKHIMLLCYECKITSGQLQCLDCNDFKWATVEDLAGYDFAPADIPVVEKIRRLE